METQITTSSTKRTFLDFSRPAFMEEADSLLNKLVPEGSPEKIVEMLGTLTEIFKDLKSSNIDEVWEKIEKKLNKRKPIQSKQKTPEAKLRVAFSLFYSATNELDKKTQLSMDIKSATSYYKSSKISIQSRLLPNLPEVKDKRAMERIMKITDNRLSKIAKNFNERMAKGEVYGNQELSTTI